MTTGAVGGLPVERLDPHVAPRHHRPVCPSPTPLSTFPAATFLPLLPRPLLSASRFLLTFSLSPNPTSEVTPWYPRAPRGYLRRYLAAVQEHVSLRLEGGEQQLTDVFMGAITGPVKNTPAAPTCRQERAITRTPTGRGAMMCCRRLCSWVSVSRPDGNVGPATQPIHRPALDHHPRRAIASWISFTGGE